MRGTRFLSSANPVSTALGAAWIVPLLCQWLSIDTSNTTGTIQWGPKIQQQRQQQQQTKAITKLTNQTKNDVAMPFEKRSQNPVYESWGLAARTK